MNVLKAIGLYVGIVAAIVAFGLGWTAKGWRVKADLAEALQQAAVALARVQGQLDVKSAEYERLRAEADGRTYRTIHTVREIYRDVKVPAVCAPDPDAIGLLLDEVARANAAASGEPLVPLRGSVEPAQPYAGSGQADLGS